MLLTATWLYIPLCCIFVKSVYGIQTIRGIRRIGFCHHFWGVGYRRMDVGRC